MPKQYSIRWTIDDAQARAAVKRGVSGLESIERAALKAATATQGTVQRLAAVSVTAQVNGHAKVAAAATATANQVVRAKKASVDAVQAVEDKYYLADYRRLVRREQNRQRLDDLARARDEKRVRSLEDLESAYVVRDYQRRVAHERRKESAALGPYGRLAQVRRRDLTDEQIHAAAINKIRDKIHNDAINRQIKEYGYGQDNFRASIAAALGLGNALTAVGAAAGALATVRKLAGETAAAFREAHESAAAFGRTGLDFLERIRPVASVAGRQPDEAFAQEVAQFGVQSGLGPDKGNRFLESFLGRAQIVKGKTLAEPEFARYQLLAGQLAATKGLEGDVAGELLGGVLKTENFAAKGQGANEAFGRAATALKILDAGSGKLPVLGPQLARLLASLTKENGLEGVFRNAGEAAVATSTAAEYDPGEAAVLVERTAQGLRDFQDKDKQGFFRRAGITGKDTFFESVQKANRVIGEEVAKGVPVDEALSRFGFTEARELKGLKTFYGAREDVLAPQLATLAASEAPGATTASLAALGEGMKSETVRDSVTRAQIEAAKIQRGTLSSEAVIARQGAEAGLIGQGVDDTFLGRMRQRLYGAASGILTFGNGPSGRDVLIEQAAVENLRRQARAAGVPGANRSAGAGEIGGGLAPAAAFGPLGALFAPAFRAAGSAAFDDNAKLIRELTEAIKTNTQATQRNTGGGTATPSMIPVGVSPPVPGR